jgi:hypothetical protein
VFEIVVFLAWCILREKGPSATEIPVSKLVSAELCGHLSLPLPTAVGGLYNC